MSGVLDALRKKYDIKDDVFSKLGLRDYTVSLRHITYSDADIPHGIKGTPSEQDTAISPTPRVRIASLSMVARTNGYVQAGDIFVDVTATITRETIDTASYLVYDSMLWNIIRVDAKPDISRPEQWTLLCRKVQDVSG